MKKTKQKPKRKNEVKEILCSKKENNNEEYKEKSDALTRIMTTITQPLPFPKDAHFHPVDPSVSTTRQDNLSFLTKPVQA